MTNTFHFQAIVLVLLAVLHRQPYCYLLEPGI
jgi:hypothetical protein